MTCVLLAREASEFPAPLLLGSSSPTARDPVPGLAGAVFEQRALARNTAVERLGRVVASLDDVHSIAEAISDDLLQHLHAEAIALSVLQGEEMVPVRTTGEGRGTAVERRLVLGGRTGTISSPCSTLSAMASA